MTTETPQWLSYLAAVGHDGRTRDPERPQLACTVMAGSGQGVAVGTTLWVCLPRDAPPRTTLAERAHAWLSPAVQWAATLAVTAVGDGWARCRVVERNDDLPEMDFGVVGGMAVYLPRWED